MDFTYDDNEGDPHKIITISCEKFELQYWLYIPDLRTLALFLSRSESGLEVQEEIKCGLTNSEQAVWWSFSENCHWMKIGDSESWDFIIKINSDDRIKLISSLWAGISRTGS